MNKIVIFYNTYYIETQQDAYIKEGFKASSTVCYADIIWLASSVNCPTIPAQTIHKRALNYMEG
jgi:hypothetical protein